MASLTFLHTQLLPARARAPPSYLPRPPMRLPRSHPARPPPARVPSSAARLSTAGLRFHRAKIHPLYKLSQQQHACTVCDTLPAWRWISFCHSSPHGTTTPPTAVSVKTVRGLSAAASSGNTGGANDGTSATSTSPGAVHQCGRQPAPPVGTVDEDERRHRGRALVTKPLPPGLPRRAHMHGEQQRLFV